MPFAHASGIVIVAALGGKDFQPRRPRFFKHSAHLRCRPQRYAVHLERDTTELLSLRRSLDRRLCICSEVALRWANLGKDRIFLLCSTSPAPTGCHRHALVDSSFFLFLQEKYQSEFGMLCPSFPVHISGDNAIFRNPFRQNCSTGALEAVGLLAAVSKFSFPPGWL